MLFGGIIMITSTHYYMYPVFDFVDVLYAPVEHLVFNDKPLKICHKYPKYPGSIYKGTLSKPVDELNLIVTDDCLNKYDAKVHQITVTRLCITNKWGFVLYVANDAVVGYVNGHFPYDEEPVTGLHPYWEDKLSSYIMEVCEKHNCTQDDIIVVLFHDYNDCIEAPRPYAENFLFLKNLYEFDGRQMVYINYHPEINGYTMRGGEEFVLVSPCCLPMYPYVVKVKETETDNVITEIEPLSFPTENDIKHIIDASDGEISYDSSVYIYMSFEYPSKRIAIIYTDDGSFYVPHGNKYFEFSKRSNPVHDFPHMDDIQWPLMIRGKLKDFTALSSKLLLEKENVEDRE